MQPEMGHWTLQTFFFGGGTFGFVVMMVLVLMSIVSLTVVLQRWFSYRSAKSEKSSELLARLQESMPKNQQEAADLFDAGGKPGPVSRTLKSLMIAHYNGFDETGVQQIAQVAIQTETENLQQYLSVIGTVGATAPFVGLLGTVVGIMASFQAIAAAGGTAGPAVVAAGIAHALVATALGLVVAVPAVMFYNYFLGRMRVHTQQITNSVNEVLAMLYHKTPVYRSQ